MCRLLFVSALLCTNRVISVLSNKREGQPERGASSSGSDSPGERIGLAFLIALRSRHNFPRGALAKMLQS
jgi:hypothetical protein